MRAKAPVKKSSRRVRQSGNALLEFAVVFPCLTILFFGSVGLGVMLGRYIQAVQVCRDVAHLYADKALDFTTTSMQNIVTQKLASGVGMTNTGGNGVVILTKVITIYDADCTAGGVDPSNCPNKGYPVITQRIVIGASDLRSSKYGSVGSGLADAEGNISAADYLRNTGLRAGQFETDYDDGVFRSTGVHPNPPTTPGQPAGDSVYVTEVFFKFPDIGFLGWTTSGGAYSYFFYQ